MLMSCICYTVTGELGGYMGLLIGASVLTLCEFVDLILYEIFFRGFGSDKDEDDEDEDEKEENEMKY